MRALANGRGRLVVALLAALTAIALLAVVLTAALPHRAHTRSPVARDAPAPGPIIASTRTRTTTRGPSLADVAAARKAAVRFLRSYLPVLYGRRAATEVRGLDAHVAASLRAAAPVQRASAARRPRVTALQARAQSANRVLMIATIADRVSRPYRVVFAVSRQATGRWLVSELANY